MPVAILQSLDDPQVTLLVTDPARIDPLYAPQLSSQDRTAVGLDDDTKPTLLCTLTIADDGWLTANLLGPLVVNPVTRQGKQIVLTDTAFTTRHRVAPFATDDQAACSS
jgi:flagellar assembly factor FliW